MFKLIVQPTESCLDLLRYIDKNIKEINSMGAGIRVEKITKDEIDDDLIAVFNKQGITRLPAMIAPDNHIFIGLRQISDVFQKNLNNGRNRDRASAYSGADAEFGSNPDLTDFYMKELYSGVTKRGKFIPREDDDDDDAELNKHDIQRRMAQYDRNKPRHRRAGGGERNRDYDDEPRRRRYDDDDVDNIDDSDDEPEPPRRGGKKRPQVSNSGDARGDDMDDQMLAAWMDNNPVEN